MSSTSRLYGLSVAGVLVLCTAIAQQTEDDVTMTLSAHIYSVSETVEFTVFNNSDSVLTFGSQPPLAIYTLPSGDLFFPEITFPMESYLNPHESQTYAVDESYGFYGEFPPGRYRLDVEFWYGTHASGWSGMCVDSFEVRDDSPVDPRTWGRIKEVWR
jgi:hypothetical protein